MKRTKLTINTVAKTLTLLLLFVAGITSAQTTTAAPKDTTPKDTTKKVETIKLQLVKRLNKSIERTTAYLETVPVDSIDIGLTYALLDIIKRKFGLKFKMADKVAVESKFPELKTGRLKLYGIFYDNNKSIPFTQQELDKLKAEPITSLYDDKYLLGVSMFCNELPTPPEYLTTFAARIQKYKEERTGLDPITAGFAYINFDENNCKEGKLKLDSLYNDIAFILTNKNAGNLRALLDLEWFYSEQMNLLPPVLTSAMLYKIGKCNFYTYNMLFKLLEFQNEDGGWHMLVQKGNSSYSASVAYLWLMLELKANADCIDKTADLEREDAGTPIPPKD